MSATHADEHAPIRDGATIRLPEQAGLPLRRTIELLCFAALPVAMVALFVFAGGPARAFDFHQFWQGGRDVLDGVSPYPASPPSSEAAAGLSPSQIQEVFRFPYPAPAALAMVPFALLPFSVASWGLLALLVASILASLRVLGVRDWRCYGAAFLWVPVLGGIRLGTLTPFLVFGLAAVWRYRDRVRVAAPLVAALVVPKLFLWPVLLWLAASRRTATAVAGAIVAAAAVVAAWAAIGFSGFADYPELLRRLGETVQHDGYSIVALVVAAGGGDAVARATALILGAVLLGGVAWVGRRRHDSGGASVALALGLLAALALSPIVWLHYFALLLVPVAIASPRLGVAWLVPLGFWLTPYHESDGEFWRISLALTFVVTSVAVVAVGSLRGPPAKRG